MNFWKAREVISKGVRLASDLQQLVKDWPENPTPMNYITTGASVWRKYRSAFQRDSNLFFKDKKAINSRYGISDVVFKMSMQSELLEEIPTLDTSSLKILAAHIHGIQFYWRVGSSSSEGPYYDDTIPKEVAEAAIGRFIWEFFEGHIVVVADTEQRWSTGIKFRQDNLTESLPSGTAKRIYEDIKKFHDKGHNRSVLLYGTAGTGKSHVIRSVANMAGGMTIRLDASAIGALSTFVHLVGFLRPSAILIDDIDDGYMVNNTLTKFESLVESTNLILATANNITRLKPAMIRPGRFDELINIEHLDDEVIDKVAGEMPDDAKAIIHQLPIAYISEYHKIKDALGPEVALQRIKDLKKRADEIEERIKNK